MKNFEGFGLSPILTATLAKMKYTTPTPIQAQAIPLALKGRDIMGSAQTGTGKTAAFAIPLVEALLQDPTKHALVLTPTRELGKQIMDIMHQLIGHQSGIKTAFLIGGEPMGKQFNQLRARARLVVGTPGRVNDHLERGSLELDNTRFLVLDETDRMLDMGFSVQIDRIVKYLPKDRQSLMFSATLPDNIMKMSQNYQNNPERIAVGSTINPAENIKQEVIRVTNESKYSELTRELEARGGSVIVFVKTKHGADRLAKKLCQEDFKADAIHGDLRQSRRDNVIRNFRKKAFRILVATDVVARGLDIPHIEHVINYDLPQVPEDYIHRIGRTARAGATGSSLCMITPQDGRKWHAIEMLMNPNAKPMASAEPFKRGKGPGKSFGKKPFRKGGNAGAQSGFGRKEGGFSKGKPASNGGNNRKPDFSKDGNTFERAERNDRNGNTKSAPQEQNGNKKTYAAKPSKGFGKPGSKPGFGAKPKFGGKPSGNKRGGNAPLKRSGPRQAA